MEDDPKQAGAGLHQQIRALVAVTGVMLAAMRRAGLMTPEDEELLSSGLVEAAASQSELVRRDWDLVVSAVQKISAATTGAERKSEP